MKPCICFDRWNTILASEPCYASATYVLAFLGSSCRFFLIFLIISTIFNRGSYTIRNRFSNQNRIWILLTRVTILQVPILVSPLSIKPTITIKSINIKWTLLLKNKLKFVDDNFSKSDNNDLLFKDLKNFVVKKNKIWRLERDVMS